MSQLFPFESNSISSKLVEITRVQSWWSYKFSPVLATFYATVCFIGVPVLPLLPKLLLLLAALVVGATYVSVINDWTDLADDRAGGKYNHMAGKSRLFPGLLLGACVAADISSSLHKLARQPNSDAPPPCPQPRLTR